MPEISYNALIEAPVEVVWDFAKDIKNWAPLLKYYESLEELNERESIWTMKGEIGPFTRITKLRVIITEWLEQQRVAFDMEGINEPIKGSGNVSLNSNGGESRIPGATTVSITLSRCWRPGKNREILPMSPRRTFPTTLTQGFWKMLHSCV